MTWLKDFLTGRQQLVLVNGEQSDATEVTSGVPQGTVLAPLLFLCFINDLPSNILSTVRLYADMSIFVCLNQFNRRLSQTSEGSSYSIKMDK